APVPGDRPRYRRAHGRCGTLPEVAARVDRRAVHAHLVVEVSAGRTAARADCADRLSAADELALAHVERGEMTVERVQPPAVVDDDEAAVAAVAAGEDDLTRAARGDRVSVGCGDVETTVHLGPLAPR